ncbi:MAG: IreB family regulatory phosphoprotein [Gracilibacteraceae bacterium]|nr:IreB family regulatory phosphoprotein [Gracilibacteraceae bacterium]
MSDLEETKLFRKNRDDVSPGEIFAEVYNSLREKGYDPINQVVGYLMSGDPAYITSHKQARTLIRKIERHELLEELVRGYMRALERD